MLSLLMTAHILVTKHFSLFGTCALLYTLCIVNNTDKVHVQSQHTSFRIDMYIDINFFSRLNFSTFPLPRDVLIFEVDAFYIYFYFFSVQFISF